MTREMGPRCHRHLASQPNDYSKPVDQFLWTSEELKELEGKPGGYGDNSILVGLAYYLADRFAYPMELSAIETERLLDILKSYREDPEEWGGITEICQRSSYKGVRAAEFVVDANGAFLRVDEAASRYLTDDQLNRIIEKIQFTRCRCCNHWIERIPLLRLYEERAQAFRDAGGVGYL